MQPIAIRYLTIQTMCHRNRIFGENNNSFPAIKIEGKWLIKWGFTIGSVVCVTEEPGRLIIQADGVPSCPVSYSDAIAQLEVERAIPNVPQLLTPAETENPLTAARSLFKEYRLEHIRTLLEMLVSNTCLLKKADLGGLNPTTIRMHQESIVKIVEACYLICQEGVVVKETLPLLKVKEIKRRNPSGIDLQSAA